MVLAGERRGAERLATLAGIVSFDDVPVAYGRMVSRQPEQGFERNMPVKSAIVAKNEFVEIGVHMLAAQAVIRAETPSFQQCEDPMNPRQHDVRRHLAGHARIVPVAGQAGIGCVAIGEQRGSTLHIGSHEGFDRSGGIIHDHGEADAARARIEIFCVLASRLGTIDVAIDHLDGADDEDFSRIAGLEECIAFAEGNFHLIDLDDSLQWFAVWIDHRPAQLLRQEPGGSVGEAELILQLPRRHAIGMRRHEMCRPEPCRQRQLGAVHRRACCDRRLSTTIEAFAQTRPTLQRHRPALAAARADETIRPAPFEQERNAASFVRKRHLKLGKRARSGHRASVPPTLRDRPDQSAYYI
jgi:hypothetical protein